MKQINTPAMRWLLASIALPAALVGCTGNQTARSNESAAPQERVAGERQEEPKAEVLEAIRASGLPETFSFGGRMWRGHEVHRVDRDDIRMWPVGQAAAEKPQENANPFDYTPVADLNIDGRAIYRKAGLDEAVTDNIYLVATEPPAPAAGAAQPAPGSPPDAQVTVVEYDAIRTMENPNLDAVLAAASLPKTIQHAGKTWTAKEVEAYDPDEFDDMGAVAQKIEGHAAYQDDDDKDELVLMGAVGGGSAANASGTTAAPATGDAAMPSGDTSMISGPIFIRYEDH